MGSRTRRSHANQPTAVITAQWGLQNYHYTNRCIFEICICLSGFQPYGSKHSDCITDIMNRHVYLLTLILTDKGSAFVSQVIHEVAKILGIKLKHATTRHAETIGVLERAHATIKTSLKKASVEYREQWHKYLPIAILNYNTICHSSIDCQPSRVFHGGVPHNILDHKLGLRFIPIIAPITDFADELLHRPKILYNKSKKIVMQS